MSGIHITVAQYNVVHPFADGLFRLLAKCCECFLQSGTTLCYFKQQGQFHRFETFVADVAKNIQLCIAQDGMVEAHHLTMAFAGCQDVHAHGADIFRQ